MTYQLDPEIAPVLSAIVAQAAGAPPIERGDWRSLRERGNVGQAFFATLDPESIGVECERRTLELADGDTVELRWYYREGSTPGSAIVFAHGGGMILGKLDAYDRFISWYVAQSGVPFLAVDYRLAPEVNGPTLAEDVYAAICWLADHATELGVDPARIAVMGDSGGGGVAAGAAILARDNGFPLASQVLVYPMLDDRNIEPDPERDPSLPWTYDDNFTAWSAVLGEDRGSDAVPPAAAPARLVDFRGLAPAFMDVGDLDIFRDETISYAQRLALARVPIELHVYPGAPHGFERFVPQARVARVAMASRVAALQAV